MLRQFAPRGVNRALEWKARFEAIGFDAAKAWRAALSKQMRAALVDSRVEHIPATLRTSLPLVIDIGANIGQWISAFMMFASVGRIEAFEPNPEVFELLRGRLGNRPDTHLHQFALGEEQATSVLNITQGSGLSSLLVPSDTIRVQYAPSAEIVRQLPVRVVPLDQALTGETIVDLMKIDVQGFEHSVLRGARETLKRTRAVLIETNFVSHYVGDGSFGSLFNHLTEIGFDFWDVSSPYRGKEAQALWADAVFINPELAHAS